MFCFSSLLLLVVLLWLSESLVVGCGIITGEQLVLPLLVLWLMLFATGRGLLIRRSASPTELWRADGGAAISLDERDPRRWRGVSNTSTTEDILWSSSSVILSMIGCSM